MPARRWTPEQRAARAAQAKAYYQTHDHPRRDTRHTEATKERMRKPKHRGPVLGYCGYCGRPLYDPVSAERGYGDGCAGFSGR